MDTLEICGEILQPGGQLETPGLVAFDLPNLHYSDLEPLMKQLFRNDSIAESLLELSTWFY